MKTKHLSQKQINYLLCVLGQSDMDRHELSLVEKAASGKEEDEFNLYQHFRDFGLCEGTEIPFVETCSDWLIQDYCKYRGIKSAEAAAILVESGKIENIDAYLSSDKCPLLPRTVEAKLLKLDNAKLLKKHIECGRFQDPATEKAFAKSTEISLIVYYLKRHQMRDESFYIVVERLLQALPGKKADADLKKVIDAGDNSLYGEVVTLIVNKAPAEYVLLMITKGRVGSSAELALIERGDHRLIMEFLERDTFEQIAAETALLQRNNVKELELFFDSKKHIDERTVRATFTHCNEECRRLLISRTETLYGEAEKTFFRLATREELLAYVEEHPFTEDTLRAIVRRRDHELLSRHLTLYGVESFWVQNDIVKKGFHDEIMLLINNKKCGFWATYSLIMRGNTEEILAAIKMNRIKKEDAKLLIKRGNRQEIEAFIQHEQVEIEIPD